MLIPAYALVFFHLLSMKVVFFMIIIIITTFYMLINKLFG